jgi:hypothetical protein
MGFAAAPGLSAPFAFGFFLRFGVAIELLLPLREARETPRERQRKKNPPCWATANCW